MGSFGKIGRAIKRTVKKEIRRSSKANKAKDLKRFRSALHTPKKVSSATNKYIDKLTHRNLNRYIGAVGIGSAAGIGTSIALRPKKKSKPGSKSFSNSK